MANANVNVTVTIQTDMRKALAQLAEAIKTTTQVAGLPVEIGARIRWTGNGLEWTRVGDDEWQPAEPDDLTLEQAREGGWTAPSSHIASGSYVVLD
jgi:hypothetical protein